MKFLLPIATMSLVMSCPAGWANASLAYSSTATTPVGNPWHPAARSESQLWVNMGGFSRHFSRSKGYNESNFGLGVEYRVDPNVSVLAGSYYNSLRRTTTYAMVNWQPWRWMGWKVGASAGVMDGYPAVARGGSFFVAVPMLTYEGQRFGANLGVVPPANRVDGAVVLQLKMRVW